MEHIIKIEVKRNYGTDHYYPRTHAAAICDLTGQKTLSARHMNALGDLGFSFQTIAPGLPGRPVLKCCYCQEPLTVEQAARKANQDGFAACDRDQCQQEQHDDPERNFYLTHDEAGRDI